MLSIDGTMASHCYRSVMFEIHISSLVFSVMKIEDTWVRS